MAGTDNRPPAVTNAGPTFSRRRSNVVLSVAELVDLVKRVRIFEELEAYQQADANHDKPIRDGDNTVYSMNDLAYTVRQLMAIEDVQDVEITDDVARRFLDERFATRSSAEQTASQPAPSRPQPGQPVQGRGVTTNAPPGRFAPDHQGGLSRFAHSASHRAPPPSPMKAQESKGKNRAPSPSPSISSISSETFLTYNSEPLPEEFDDDGVPIISTNSTYYAVIRGRDTGVFNDWSVVAPLVVSVSGSVFRQYKTYEEAASAYEHAKECKQVAVLQNTRSFAKLPTKSSVKGSKHARQAKR